MDVKNCFFDLLKAGLWGTQPTEELFRQKNVDWEGIMNMSVNQTVPGIVFDGVEKLPAGLLPPRPIMMKWFALVTRIEQANGKLNHELDVISRIYAENEIPFILLKGQGCASIYLNPLHRQCGDLDLYVGSKSYGRTIELMNDIGLDASPQTDKHAGYTFHGVSVEIHRYAATFSSPFRNRKLQRFIHEWLCKPGKTVKLDAAEVCLPAPGFNAIYLFVHSLLHFIQEGIGLRQVCDWTRTLYVYADEINTERLVREVSDLGLERAFGAFGYIAVTYLGLPVRCFPIPADKELGELLLSDMIRGGNFGQLHTRNEKRSRTKWSGKFRTFIRVCKRCRMTSRFYRSEACWYPLFRIKFLANRLFRGES